MLGIRFSQTRQEALFIGGSAALTGLLLAALISLVVFICIKGSAYLWPKPIERLEYVDKMTGALTQVYAHVDYAEEMPEYTRVWLQASTQDVPGRHPLMLELNQIKSLKRAEAVAKIELIDGRAILAEVTALSRDGISDIPVHRLPDLLDVLEEIRQSIQDIRDDELAPIHEELAQYNERDVEADAPARQRLNAQYDALIADIEILEARAATFLLTAVHANQQAFSIPLMDVQHIHYPNEWSSLESLGFAIAKLCRFVSEPPKQGNTAGGVFPAIFGTVLMVLLMTLIVTPLGVAAAIYLSEYAGQGGATSLLRICVNNMAGVPSVVYGVFGLGFLVYAVGGQIDKLFYSDALPSPTFGAPGLLWASMTMALLTLPVVIVATEEGLKRVPQEWRLGSYALGATKAETLFKTIIPNAMPGIITGVILAIARAAGEVAPLILVGAVKFAPSLPVDGEFPYLHLERQFMHLGTLVYDGAFHSQNYSKGASSIFTACALLLIIVFMLNILAISIRNRLRRKQFVGLGS